MTCSNVALSCIPQARVGGAELVLKYDKVPPDTQFSGLILLRSIASNCHLPSLQWSDGVNILTSLASFLLCLTEQCAIDPETHKLKDTSEILFYDSESSNIPLPQTVGGRGARTKRLTRFNDSIAAEKLNDDGLPTTESNTKSYNRPSKKQKKSISSKFQTQMLMLFHQMRKLLVLCLVKRFLRKGGVQGSANEALVTVLLQLKKLRMKMPYPQHKSRKPVPQFQRRLKFPQSNPIVNKIQSIISTRKLICQRKV
ncbi:hypothetical protein BDQ17DRAFT_645468 [Cyathus striatus]|nr:hypothetical protein BDQ17DRAFT_645468 [Cyathus striatus]